MLKTILEALSAAIVMAIVLSCDSGVELTNNDSVDLKNGADNDEMVGKRSNDSSSVELSEVAVVDWQEKIENYMVSDMVVDEDGNAYVTGELYGEGIDSVYYTIKYDMNGYRKWSASYSGSPSGLNMTEAIAIDGDRNVYVTGASAFGDVYDYATIKYSADGEELWVARYDGLTGDEDWAYDVQVDSEGNVYVMGDSSNGANVDVVTVKYDEDGRELWVGRYDSGDDDSVIGSGQTLVVDTSGNVYTIGFFVFLKYDESGKKLWEIIQQCSAIVLDEEDNVVLTSPRGTQVFRPDGSVAWQTATGGTQLVVVPSKGIWVSSPLIEDHYDWDFQTSRLGENGEVLWTSVYDSGYADSPASLAVDASGNAYVTGSSDSRKGLLGALSPDLLTVKYNGQGEEIWTKRRKSGYGEEVAVDAAGFVYVTGFDGYTVKYSQEEKSCDWWNLWCRNN